MGVNLARLWLLGGALLLVSCGGGRGAKHAGRNGSPEDLGLAGTPSETCGECHAVVAAEWAAGTHADVPCAACHVRDDVVLGTADFPDAPHAMEVLPRMEAWTVCLPCHTQRGPGADVFIDWLAWQQNTWRGATCVDCHQPVALRLEAAPPRPGFDHRMPGGGDLDTAKSGVTLRAIELKSDGFAFPIANKTGHRFPAAGTSKVEVFAQSLDAAGATVGQGTAWLRAGDGVDTRLLPGELRALRFRFDGVELAHTASYRVTVRYYRPDGQVLVLGARDQALNE